MDADGRLLIYSVKNERQNRVYAPFQNLDTLQMFISSFRFISLTIINDVLLDCTSSANIQLRCLCQTCHAAIHIQTVSYNSNMQTQSDKPNKFPCVYSHYRSNDALSLN